jgi:hypothetical protein
MSSSLALRADRESELPSVLVCTRSRRIVHSWKLELAIRIPHANPGTGNDSAHPVVLSRVSESRSDVPFGFAGTLTDIGTGHLSG